MFNYDVGIYARILVSPYIGEIGVINERVEIPLEANLPPYFVNKYFIKIRNGVTFEALENQIEKI